MRLTTKSQYGLKVLSLLIRHHRGGTNDFVQISSMAAECRTSQKYLEQVLAQMARAGYLESKRGQHGGYRLSRDPRMISLAEVIRSLEGLLLPIPAWADEGVDGSPVGVVLRRVRDSIRSILEETSIEVLVGGGERADPNGELAVKELMYYI